MAVTYNEDGTSTKSASERQEQKKKPEPRYLPNKTPNKDGTINEIGVPNPRHPGNNKYFENRPGKRKELIDQGY